MKKESQSKKASNAAQLVKKVASGASNAAKGAAEGVAKGISNIQQNIKSRQKITKDVKDTVDWVDNRNQQIVEGNVDVAGHELPTLVKVIYGGEVGMQDLSENEKAVYTAYLDENSDRKDQLTVSPKSERRTFEDIIASASGMALLTSQVGMAVAGASILRLASPFLVVPGLRIISLAAFAVNVGSAISTIRGKEPQGTKLEQTYNRTQSLLMAVLQKYDENTHAIMKAVMEKTSQAVKGMEEASRKIAISIDDVVHSDQNLRLMQYQQICLDQYNSQIELRNTLSEILKENEELRQKNEELEKQIAAYAANLETLTRSAEYLK